MIRAGLRCIGLVSILTVFLLNGIALEIVFALSFRPKALRQKARSKRVAHTSRFILRFLGFHARVEGREWLGTARRPSLIVANHLSFWDILMLSQHLAPIFITSIELKNTPVLGWLARLGGSVFVERRSRNGIETEISGIVQELKSGQTVVLFPEATSTNGEGVLPFKRSLFRAALEAGVPVVPVAINYRSIDGEKLGRSNRDKLFYYGDQTFSDQIRHVFKMRSVEVELRFLPPLLPGEGVSHKELCEEAYRVIVASYDPIP